MGRLIPSVQSRVLAMNTSRIVADLCGGAGIFLVGLVLLSFPGCAAPRGCNDMHVPACGSLGDDGCQEDTGECRMRCGGDPCDPGMPNCACRTKYYQALQTYCLCALPDQGT
jgi:hypothetical protein